MTEKKLNKPLGFVLAPEDEPIMEPDVFEDGIENTEWAQIDDNPKEGKGE